MVKVFKLLVWLGMVTLMTLALLLMLVGTITIVQVVQHPELAEIIGE